MRLQVLQAAGLHVHALVPSTHPCTSLLHCGWWCAAHGCSNAFATHHVVLELSALNTLTPKQSQQCHAMVMVGLQRSRCMSTAVSAMCRRKSFTPHGNLSYFTRNKSAAQGKQGRVGPHHGGGREAAQQVREHGDERAVQARLRAGRAGRARARQCAAPHRGQRRRDGAQVRRDAVAQHLLHIKGLSVTGFPTHFFMECPSWCASRHHPNAVLGTCGPELHLHRLCSPRSPNVHCYEHKADWHVR